MPDSIASGSLTLMISRVFFTITRKDGAENFIESPAADELNPAGRTGQFKFASQHP
ncbi:MAG: hypothetical protein ROZ00_03845 [Denitratisoma sp.]|nr:hypothetical protein [Denitratisoma sp.]